MKNKSKSKSRALGFERLESKCVPTTLLLAVAPLDESFHVTVEQARDQGCAELVCPAAATSENWQFQFTTADLLQFVHNNTHSTSVNVTAISQPTKEQCRSADEMMKLGDQDLRAFVIADSLHVA